MRREEDGKKEECTMCHGFVLKITKEEIIMPIIMLKDILVVIID